MKWIKASERLPEDKGIYFCKVQYFSNSKGILTKVAVEFDGIYWSLYDENKVIAWLDETSPSDNTQIRDGGYSREDIENAIMFGFRQNDKNGAINLNEKAEFITKRLNHER